ncbi:MAG: hypothetical protein ACTSPL_04240 [Candidatus Odinarchaeia archaeon]
MSWKDELSIIFEKDVEIVYVYCGKKVIMIPFDDFDKIVAKYLKIRGNRVRWNNGE